MNNYQKSLELLRDSDFTVKKLVTFNGHEGRGANADIYWKKRKVATFIDEGNGGEPYVYWHKAKPQGGWGFVDEDGIEDSCKEFIASLPHYSLAERYEDDSDFAYDWDETPNAWKAKDVIDALVHVAEERREFKKTLRKVCGYKDGSIYSYKYKKTELEKELKYEGKRMSLRDCLAKSGMVCLNLLPETEAFALLRKHG